MPRKRRYAGQYGRRLYPSSRIDPGKFGDEFELIDRGDRLVLVPVPDEPLEALRDEARRSEKTADELKESALDATLEEAGRTELEETD
ncbi:AbrB/MazE/SpoVT family DNA-binding domain-containing protein [Natrinema thermotolerans]|uniref:AbrB/MazE/SpoVT family DNA-binding domain-containing protein n=1 Tax=Natrinema thermotolerans TaxID=121872 RepID=A0AAF0PAE7_9EURY|nr:AbrB/MazE/SpoVT family DNA-binding domain-containing protein [Natrinema thermotolerans]WMT07416.1 AbrB/MazE/SpoVT family DNA-binding domain-containing protein [Natrinema thermotolerans]WMT08048.1 AbrB/MazE/SpoVT family DNA-binding domain-containing protein [Natrinema thermotolerans]